MITQLRSPWTAPGSHLAQVLRRGAPKADEVVAGGGAAPGVRARSPSRGGAGRGRGSAGGRGGVRPGGGRAGGRGAGAPPGRVRPRRCAAGPPASSPRSLKQTPLTSLHFTISTPVPRI